MSRGSCHCKGLLQEMGHPVMSTLWMLLGLRGGKHCTCCFHCCLPNRSLCLACGWDMPVMAWEPPAAGESLHVSPAVQWGRWVLLLWDLHQHLLLVHRGWAEAVALPNSWCVLDNLLCFSRLVLSTSCWVSVYSLVFSLRHLWVSPALCGILCGAAGYTPCHSICLTSCILFRGTFKTRSLQTSFSFFSCEMLLSPSSEEDTQRDWNAAPPCPEDPVVFQCGSLGVPDDRVAMIIFYGGYSRQSWAWGYPSEPTKWWVNLLTSYEAARQTDRLQSWCLVLEF